MRGAFVRFLPCAAWHGEMKHRTSEVTQVWAEKEKNYGCGLILFKLKSFGKWKDDCLKLEI